MFRTLLFLNATTVPMRKSRLAVGRYNLTFLFTLVSVDFMLPPFLENGFLNACNYQNYGKQHNRHRRRKTYLLILERRFNRFDNEGACSGFSAGDDIGNLKHRNSAFDCQNKLKRYYGANARKNYIPEALPRISSVQSRRFIDIRRYRLYSSYIHDNIKTDVSPN